MSIASNIKQFVICESPYAGDIEKNLRYVRACIRDSILRGEAPFASHALYTQPGVLRDEVHEERELGMGLGWQVMRHADHVNIYTDLGWSSGMLRGANYAVGFGLPIFIRRLGGEWSTSQWGVDYGATYQDDPQRMREASFTFKVYDDLANVERHFVEVDTKQGYGITLAPESLGFELVKSKGLRLTIGE